MGRILIVDSDHDSSDLIQHALGQEGHSFQVATDVDTALHRIRAWKPQVVLLDDALTGGGSVDVAGKIRALSPDDYISVILLSAGSGGATALPTHDAGHHAPDDLVNRPFRAQELAVRVRSMLRYKESMDSLRRANHRIEELSQTDPITGMLNVPAFFRKAEEEILRSRRFRKPMSLLAVNLDGFRSVNEAGGFGFGNIVLRGAAKRIRECVRNIDLVGRLGADEFLIFLVETDLAAGEFMAERIRDSIRTQVFKSDRSSAQVTCSIGIAGFNHDQHEQTLNDMVRLSLEALRSAKSGGRDQVEIYSFA